MLRLWKKYDLSCMRYYMVIGIRGAQLASDFVILSFLNE